ncbi:MULTISPECIES: TetR/AcrR family transcriptional regulator [Pseudoalteromonas]|uniref:TetR/AcrR family transcriptional regulator n=1 Tax=Pseudoalteromonas maricaloris TaxID=184924 RepID=A0A8I2H5Q2_9GAMM|nr:MULTISPECIES: TetR/AcrR family transcriptional regulator [Pseudoalteromonas]NLR21704.1 TetR/AcrR family transcriptional regulator [Pseudoalteromonas maricaloris]RZG13751.1 TetR/AcrR family transcriptional regulator [Pseudoalteromonas sp. CO342X]WOX28244.1 TetR/AcrR family transcriptional regulator [Pseudoalteromonas maricaloris]
MAPAPKYDKETQQRMILNAAEQCINESSVTDFTMAKVSLLAGLSMGSIYKFVQTKEDLVMALAYESFTHTSSVFKQVLSLPLSTPERMLAVCLISPQKLKRFSFDYELQSYSTNEAVIKRASEFWTNKIIKSCDGCENVFKQALIDGIEAGELQTTPDLHDMVEEIIITGWALTVGYEQVLRVQQTKQIVEGTASLLTPLELNDPVIRSTVRLLNSYPWQQPITQDSLVRIEKELQALELR